MENYICQLQREKSGMVQEKKVKENIICQLQTGKFDQENTICQLLKEKNDQEKIFTDFR